MWFNNAVNTDRQCLDQEQIPGRESQQGPFSYTIHSTPASEAITVPREVTLFAGQQGEGQSMMLCSFKHGDLEEKNKKERKGKGGGERKRRKLLAKNNMHTTKITFPGYSPLLA